MTFRLGEGSKLLLIGDSVTDCERARPVGEGLFGALGRGYVGIADSLIQATYPDRRVRVVNMGVSGNTVRDLRARWQTDVLDLAPNWLAVMIGINDVWRQFDTPWQTEWAVGLDEYAATLGELIEVTAPQLDGLVLLTPYVIEPNRADPMRQTMDAYGDAVRALAAKTGARFVDTQAAFDAATAHLHPMALAWDRIHPTQTGHAIIARALLDALDYRW